MSATKKKAELSVVGKMERGEYRRLGRGVAATRKTGREGGNGG